jgi:hypothetical protein
MRRPLHYILRLNTENPRSLFEDEGDEEGASEDPNLRARLFEDGAWAFYLATGVGFVLMPAGASGEHIDEAYLPCSVVEYLMAEHLFGLFLLGEGGVPLSKIECHARIMLDLSKLGYVPTTKSL